MRDALGGHLLAVVYVTLVVCQGISGASRSYEEYEFKTRSPLKRKPSEQEDRYLELSALNQHDDPYRDYKKERERNLEAQDRGSRNRGHRRGGAHGRHRDRDKNNHRQDEDSRDYRRPRHGDSRDYSRSQSRRYHSAFSESKPLEEMEEETFERYKWEMQEKINAEYEAERRQFIAQQRQKQKENLLGSQLGGNKYRAPNAPERKTFGQSKVNPRFEKQYGRHFRHQRKPVDTNHETMKELVFDLYSQGLIKSSKIYDVMLNIDRKHYLMKTNDSYFPYKDQIQYLPMGVIINAPHEHARALELLRDHLKPGANVLDIGSGSGYLTACFADLVGPQGQVTAVELIPEVLQFTQYNVRQGNPELLPRIKFEIADGRASFGENGPYDVIHVGAAYSKYPDIFIFHLKHGGRLVIPIGETRQQLLNIYDKFANETVERQSWGLVQFQYLKSMSQQLRIMEIPKAKPPSVALKYYIEKIMDDRIADMSDPITTTESIKRLRAGKKPLKRAKKKKFYNLAYEQKKHKLDEQGE